MQMFQWVLEESYAVVLRTSRTPLLSFCVLGPASMTHHRLPPPCVPDAPTRWSGWAHSSSQEVRPGGALVSAHVCACLCVFMHTHPLGGHSDNSQTPLWADSHNPSSVVNCT